MPGSVGNQWYCMHHILRFKKYAMQYNCTNYIKNFAMQKRKKKNSGHSFEMTKNNMWMPFAESFPLHSYRKEEKLSLTLLCFAYQYSETSFFPIDCTFHEVTVLVICASLVGTMLSVAHLDWRLAGTFPSCAVEIMHIAYSVLFQTVSTHLPCFYYSMLIRQGY